ncbi:GMC family oxidoreductase N-terminal domain-containing protein [Phyllobacterium sp. BT25]|uniref:GMC family oxidoreductase N-terminal domain-containing protein n=1 Tax=Phyllobacterium pellucidum TaxID=2740464 RepID=A0A849VQR8_9HYPH|nr:GMC family oxidoreductase N-terminal domain-containing protein [Phyllobacterium pellucidum]NTS31059.1 GMC family oxidoreductase N-terminal domain-containing protein [Phyllobacterium pellucidum]
MRSFDFIIVGSGSAGSVVANRLSENGRYSVLVLEAGGSDRRFFIAMPLGYGKTFYDKSVNWMYRAEPDPGLAGNADYWPRGKVLGGSSSINAMVYVRGAREDFDEWRDRGNPGWGAADVWPIFKALEDHDGPSDSLGRGGPLHVSDCSKLFHPLANKLIIAAQEAGLAYNPDFNGASQEGVGAFRLTTKGGRRMSAARAFLRPAMKRPNVTVLTGAMVTRILFEGKQAVGVAFTRNGRSETVKAGREVVLAGGSVNTPQLLEISGIGDPARLSQLGIDVVYANPNVGENLQDHLGINYTYRANIPSLNQVLRPWWGKAIAGIEYLLLRTGPLSISMNQGGGFFRTDPSRTRANMQLYFQAFSTIVPKNGERPILTPDPWPGFSIGLSNCRPTSTGSIHIRSADPLQAPQIVANAFSTEHDVAEMLDAVKFLRKVAATPTMSKLIVEELLPGPGCRSDEELIADFRKRSGTVYHPVSTCRMGPDPAQSVVDPRLKVHGVDGLRIIDCSIFPNIISGNTNAAAMMVGAKGAALVLEDLQ